MAEPNAALPDVTPPPSPMATLGIDESKIRTAETQIGTAKREELAASEKTLSDIDAAQQKYIPQAEAHLKNAGVEAEKLKPWNADEESAKRRTDPIAAFGSLGSAFGILASAFTHAPMENALNASAAAMNAIHEGDTKAYERAEKAWMSNWKMAMDRYKIEHDAYQDAVSLMNTDMSVAETKYRVAAARFGNRQDLALIEAGMFPKVLEAQAARQKMALELATQMPKIVEANAEISRLFALGYDAKNPQSEKSQQALQKFKQEQADWKQAERAFTPEQQAYTQFVKSKPDATPEERADYIQQLRTRKKDLTPEQEAVNSYLEQNPDAKAEDIQKFVIELRSKSRGGAARGNPDLTTDRQRAQDVKKYREELAAAKNEDGAPKYSASQIANMAADKERQLKALAAAPSGNRLDQIKGKIQQIDNIVTKSEKILAFLQTHKGGAGLVGKIMRGEEIAENIAGISTKTDRNQFRRNVRELQDIVPQILTDTQGRPLASQQAKVDDIVAGLNAGDTGPNTVRAYRELLEDIKKRRSDYELRLRTDSPPASGAPSEVQPTTKQNWRTQAIPQ